MFYGQNLMHGLPYKLRSPKKILIGGLSLGRESGNVGGSCEWEQGVVGGVEIGSIE